MSNMKETREIIEFLGFRDTAANKISTEWSSSATQIGQVSPDLMTFIAEWLNQKNVDATCENDDWAAVLDVLGINESTKAALTDKRFEDIRLTRSARSWLQEIMQARWDYLQLQEDIQYGSKNSSLTPMQIPKKIPSSGQLTNVFEEDQRVLWTSAPVNDVRYMWNDGLRGHKRFSLLPLSSSYLTDYSSSVEKYYYFTPQVQVAQKFAEFRERCTAPVTFCLVRIAVSNEIFEHSKIVKLHFPSTEFCDTVWFSRCKHKLLPPFFQLVNEADILEGDIAKAGNLPFESLLGPGNLKKDNILKIEIDGKNVSAQQIAISASSLQDKIEKNGRVEVRKWADPAERYDAI